MRKLHVGLLLLVQSFLQHMHVVLPANTAANNLQTDHQLVQGHRPLQAECMAGWQAGLLVLVQSALQHMHVVLPANTAANNLQTDHQLVQGHRSWQAECMAGWQAELHYVLL